MTARNVQDEAKRKGLPWTIAKGFDTFTPLSEPISPAAIGGDPHNVELALSVNGQLRQRDSTALMVFRIPRLLSEISKVMTLERGDVVLTGTPKGVGGVEVGNTMRAVLTYKGREVERIQVGVEEKPGPYEFAET